MEIVQVLIFMVIIAIAIVQQITKAKKETGTPSPREVLTDMFPTIEENGGRGADYFTTPYKMYSSAHPQKERKALISTNCQREYPTYSFRCKKNASR